MDAITSWRFQIWYFFECCALSEPRCIFAFGPSLIFSSFLPLLLSFRILCYFLYVPIFNAKIVLFPFYSVVVMCWCIQPLLAGNFFCCYFGMSYFVCVVLSCLGIFLVFLLLPVTSDLFPPVILLVFLAVMLFSFFLVMFQRSFSVLP